MSPSKLAPKGPIGAWAQGQLIFFQTMDLTYKVGTDGINRAFRDRHSGTNYLDITAPGHFLSITKDGQKIGSTSVALQGSLLLAEFGSSSLSATLRVQVLPQYVTLELLSVSDPAITVVELVYLPLLLTDTVGITLAHCENSQCGAAVVSLNVVTRATATPNTGGSLLQAEANASVQLAFAKIAILGCPADQLLSRLSLIEKENGLPHPVLDNVWARQSDDVKSSYLFVDLTKANVDDIIAYAKAGGFRYIVIYDWIWNSMSGTGTCSVNTTTFPNGDSDLQAVSTAVHATGLKLGMHILYGLVARNSPLAHPTPNPGFFMMPDMTLALEADTSPGQAFIPTTTSPHGYLHHGQRVLASRYTDLRGYDLLIDDEIITYEDTQTTPPYGFAVSSGAMTKPHQAGAIIKNFAEYFIDPNGYYLPDPSGALYGLMTGAVANAVQKFGFDFIYPDALGEPLIPWPGEPLQSWYTASDPRPKWYLINLLVTRLRSAIENIPRPLLFAHGITFGTTQDPDYPWHIFIRGNTRDYKRPEPGQPKVDSRAIIQHVDEVSLPGSSGFTAERDLQPFEFGWFGFVSQGHDAQGTTNADATRPREIEYVWSKALAYGASMSLESTYEALKANGRTDEILMLIKPWEDLRLANYFPESVRNQMKAQSDEFTIRKTQTGQWEVLPITYQEKSVNVVDGTDNVWTFPNPHGKQAVRITIEAGASTVSQPSLLINAATLSFPIYLQPEWYLEYAEGALGVFDANGHAQPASGPVGGPAVVNGGNNDITFSCAQGSGQAVKVTLATVGAPLQ